ncbi:MAG: response regulator transcription factor [Eggerthellaceae bacterium]|nr:response regulator transcription factor [Eggerthellaceae bacterium]
MKNILVVEDNEQLRRLMSMRLAKAGYRVFEAKDGNEALAVLEENHIHLMIVDIMMPRMDGYELTGELRGARITIPVLMVTAKGTLEDKRVGFKVGADDYMVKPVDIEELLLRVEALLRRARIAECHMLVVGDTTLNEEALTVSSKAATIVLPQKEFLLLQLLLSYPGKIFTRQALMDEIWGLGSETDHRTVDVHINRLRGKFEDCADFALQTVRGLGYKAVIS